MKPRILNLVIALLSCVGLFIAGYLAYAHYAGVSVPCGVSGQGCQVVEMHPSSKWFGIPVAAYGVVGYFGLLALAVARLFGASTKELTMASFAIAVIGGLTSIGLQIYALTVIRALCTWCLASATTMCLIALVHAALISTGGLEPDVASGPKKLDLGLIITVLAASAIGFGLMANSHSEGTVISGEKEEAANALSKDGHSLGPTDAKVVIVEFGDLYCYACQASFAHMKRLQAQYPGKIRWIFRHFPLFEKEGHELALPTAVVAEYAATKGKFWEFLEQVYAMQHDSVKSMDQVYAIAANVNVDRDGAEKAIENEKSAEIQRVTNDMALANRVGVKETPTFVLYTPGSKPVALRASDLDHKLSTPQLQALLK